jgi:hypothetical protein
VSPADSKRGFKPRLKVRIQKGDSLSIKKNPAGSPGFLYSKETYFVSLPGVAVNSFGFAIVRAARLDIGTAAAAP